MRILLSSYYLDLSGTPTYTLALYRELRSRGHDAFVYSPSGGGTDALANSLDAIDDDELIHVPWQPDAIIAHQNKCAETMRECWPSVPMIFSAHGVEYDLEQPPNCKVDAWTAINEDGVAHLQAKGVSKPVTIVRDFVDLERFAPVEPLNDKLKRVLFISNFKKWKTYDIIAEACRRLGVELTCRGAPYGRSYAIEHDINRADLVITTARGIIEAMACGRPVISFNRLRGDGYLTRQGYMASRTRNFAGENCRYSFDAESLIDELNQYNPIDGTVNRLLAVQHHDVVKGTDQLMGIVETICATSR